MKFMHGEKRYTPTVLHTSIDGTGYLCGAERIGSWHDRCMTNQFVKSLPKCEDCEAMKRQTKLTPPPDPPRIDVQHQGVRYPPITVDETIRSTGGMLYVKDYRRDA
jgi:hypothetical protein